MSRRAAPGAVLLLALLVTAACGGNPPTVRRVDALPAGSETATRESVGANLDAASEATETTTTLGTAEARLLEGAPDLLGGFADALRSGDLERAGRFTTGPALQFLGSLQKNASCGLRVTGAEVGEPTDVVIGSKGEYLLIAPSSISFSSGVTQSFDAISIDVGDDGSWRIFDLLVDRRVSVNSFLISPIPPELEFDKLRMLLVDACFAPDLIRVTVDLVSGSDFKMEFVDVYLRLPNGDRVEATARLTGLTEPIPAHGTRRWSAEFQRPGLGTLATIVLVTIDTEGKTLGLPRDRLYPVKMAPVFADVVSSSSG